MSNGDVHEHYKEVAADYDKHWNYRPGYVEWMSTRLTETLSLSTTDRMADVGCGTGLFAREIARAVSPEQPILCIDPSRAMLHAMGEPPPAGLTPIEALAEDIAEESTALPYEQLDAIWLKESVHHLADPGRTLAGLARRLSPGGRLLVVMLPKTIEYPLFASALRHFEELQPDPKDIADHLTAAGLDTRITHVQHELRIGRDRYLEMVRGRYMSLLSDFDDTALEAGIEEMRAAHPEEELVFPDRFAFIIGVRRHAHITAARGCAT
ncbi:methyltransferase [Streptomyces sp. NPDC047071]|uniref:class I SAM-dependent methyltransferase n=1 Tax=Streptomyces sp. NPDC047071 TaxID=3154808 RepID=UPI003455B31D